MGLIDSEMQRVLDENAKFREVLYRISSKMHKPDCSGLPVCDCHISLASRVLGITPRCTVFMTEGPSFSKKPKQCVLPSGHDGEHIVGGIRS